MTARILVIDDEEGVRDAFLLALEGETALEVITAVNGAIGVALAREQRPDLVFLDLNMPGMTGVEVMRLLLAEDASIPIYIVTAFHQDFMQELKAARAEGLRFELARKPLGADQIRQIVRIILGDSDQVSG
jgi:CheY-like chemotaxis protein